MRCFCLESAFQRAIEGSLAFEHFKVHEKVVRFIAHTFGVTRAKVENEIRELREKGKVEYQYSIEALRYTRKTLLGLSQGDAANLLGGSWNTWQSWEQGRCKMPLYKWVHWLEIVDKKLGETKHGKDAKEKRSLLRKMGSKETA